MVANTMYGVYPPIDLPMIDHYNHVYCHVYIHFYYVYISYIPIFRLLRGLQLYCCERKVTKFQVLLQTNLPTTPLPAPLKAPHSFYTAVFVAGGWAAAKMVVLSKTPRLSFL